MKYKALLLAALMVFATFGMVSAPAAAFDTDEQTVVVTADSDDDIAYVAGPAATMQATVNGPNVVVGAHGDSVYRPGITTTHKFADNVSENYNSVTLIGTEANNQPARDAFRASQAEDEGYQYNIDNEGVGSEDHIELAAHIATDYEHEGDYDVYVLDTQSDDFEAGLLEAMGSVILLSNGSDAEVASNAYDELDNGAGSLFVQNTDADNDHFEGDNSYTAAGTDHYNTEASGATEGEVFVVNDFSEAVHIGLAHAESPHFYFPGDDEEMEDFSELDAYNLVDGFDAGDEQTDIHYSSNSGLMSQVVHHTSPTIDGPLPAVSSVEVGDDNETVHATIENTGDKSTYGIEVEIELGQEPENVSSELLEETSYDAENETLTVTLGEVGTGELDAGSTTDLSYDIVAGGDHNPQVVDYGNTGSAGAVTFSTFDIDTSIVSDITSVFGSTLGQITDLSENLLEELEGALGLGTVGTVIVLGSGAIVMVAAVYLYFGREEEEL